MAAVLPALARSGPGNESTRTLDMCMDKDVSTENDVERAHTNSLSRPCHCSSVPPLSLAPLPSRPHVAYLHVLQVYHYSR